MKFRVVLNEQTGYLHITTFSDPLPENNRELFSVESNFTDTFNTSNCLTFCRCFCLGVLQGNTIGNVKNSPKDFESPLNGVVFRKSTEFMGPVPEEDADRHIAMLNETTAQKWKKDYSNLLIVTDKVIAEHTTVLGKGQCWIITEYY